MTKTVYCSLGMAFLFFLCPTLAQTQDSEWSTEIVAGEEERHQTGGKHVEDSRYERTRVRSSDAPQKQEREHAGQTSGHEFADAVPDKCRRLYTPVHQQPGKGVFDGEQGRLSIICIFE